VKTPSLLELGDQTLLLKEADLAYLKAFFEKFGLGEKLEKYRMRVGEKLWVSDVYEDVGFEFYCLDLSEKNNALKIDLNIFPNEAISKEYIQKFDFVANFGTTEHVGNQLNAFAIIHYLSKPGGLILHHIPMLNCSNHAMACITPKMMKKLIDWNGYDIIVSKWNSHVLNQAITFHYDASLCFIDGYLDTISKSTYAAMGLFVLQNSLGESFVPPLDVDVTGNEMLDLFENYIAAFAQPGLENTQRAALRRVQSGKKATDEWIEKQSSDTKYRGRRAYLHDELSPDLSVAHREGSVHFFNVAAPDAPADRQSEDQPIENGSLVPPRTSAIEPSVPGETWVNVIPRFPFSLKNVFAALSILAAIQAITIVGAIAAVLALMR